VIKEHNGYTKQNIEQKRKANCRTPSYTAFAKEKEEKKERGKRSTIPEMFYKAMQA
jgi:hypothetical protein